MMKMKDSMKSLVLAGVSALALAPFAVADLEKYLPDGGTYAIVKIENVKQLQTQLEADPLLAEFGDKIVTPISNDNEDMTAAFALMQSVAGEYSKTFSGEAVLALIKGDASCDAVIIADCDKNFTPEMAAELLQKSIPEEKGDVVLEKRADGSFSLCVNAACCLSECAIVDGKFIGCADPENRKKLMACVKGKGAKKSIATSPVFKKVRARIGDAPAWCYVDGATVADFIYSVAEAKDKEIAEDLKKNPEMAMFSVMVTPIVKALAPEAIESFWATYNRDGSSESALAWKENRGIVTLLTSSLKNDAGTMLPAIPASADLASASSGTFSLGAFVSQLMVLARQSSPLFGIVDMQINNLKMQNVLDVPAVLKTFGHGAYSCSYAGNNPNDSVFAVKVDDEKLVLKALDTAYSFVLEGKPAPQSTPYNGLSLYSVGPDEKFAYTFVDGYLCAGQSDSVKKFIASKKNPSIWECPEVKAALQTQMPAECCLVSYTHVGKTLSGIVSASQQEMEKTIEELGGDAEETIDGDALLSAIRKLKISDADFNYSIISKTYLNGNELVTKSVTIKNK